MIFSAVALLATACGGDDRAVTVEAPAESSTPATSTSSSVAINGTTEQATTNEPAAAQPAGVEALMAALPTITDLPTGWAIDEPPAPSPEEPDDTGTVTPPECAELFDTIGDAQPDAVAKAVASYSEGGLGPFLQVEISSYADDLAEDSLAAVVDVLGACPTFTRKDADGTVTFTAAPLSFPSLGDATLAVRLAGEADGLDISSDAVLIVSGENSISLICSGLGTSMDPGALESLARTTLERVDGI